MIFIWAKRVAEVFDFSLNWESNNTLYIFDIKAGSLESVTGKGRNLEVFHATDDSLSFLN